MLQFHRSENAIFFGLEAEGIWKGLQTIFIVGNPPVDKIMRSIRLLADRNNELGLYIKGDPGNLLKPEALALLIAQFVSNSYGRRSFARRLTIESHSLESSIDAYQDVLEQFAVKDIYFDWVVPIIGKYVLKTTEEASMWREKAKKYPLFNFFAKVFVEGEILFTVPLLACDFTSCDGIDYQSDRLVYSSIAKETV
jgi:hypothetical protein